jgi:phosphoglycolate phosphatase
MNTDPQTTMKPNAIIFDLDGTLLDTLADIGDSVNQMLAEFGLPGHTPDDYRRFIGNGIKRLVMRALPEAQRSPEMIASSVRRAREIYWENWNVKTRPYDGIAELLEGLKHRQVPLAVLSNKPHDFTVRYVDAYFGHEAFQVVMGHGDRFPVKPDPASALEIARLMDVPPSAFFFVGDSAADVKAAAAAGMHSVGAGWGFRGPKELQENGCRTLVEHPLEILPLVGGRSR